MCGSPSPKEKHWRGSVGGITMVFAKWKKLLKLTTAPALLFPLICAGWHPRRLRDPTESCSAALRVFDKLSLTLSVQSVSLSNTPSEAPAERRGGTLRAPAPSSCSGRTLPDSTLLLSKNPARYWTAYPIVTGCWALTLCCQVFLTPQFWRRLSGCS